MGWTSTERLLVWWWTGTGKLSVQCGVYALRNRDATSFSLEKKESIYLT